MSWDLFDKLDSRSLFGRENLKIQHFFQHLVLSFGLFVMISRISIRVMNKTNTKNRLKMMKFNRHTLVCVMSTFEIHVHTSSN